MESLVFNVLEQYDFTNPKIEFIRHNENITYKCIDGENTYLIRIHKPIDGFSLGIYRDNEKSTEYIASEMKLLYSINKKDGFILQKPVKNKKGLLVSVLPNGILATVLEWVQGEDISQITISKDIAEAIGSMIANFHCSTSKLEKKKITRYSYDKNILPLIDSELTLAQKSNHITNEQLFVMKDTLHMIEKTMSELEKMQGTAGFIHADLSPSNMILSNKRIVPIDFSLSGFGYYYMDIAGILAQLNDLALRKNIIDGYEKAAQTKILVKHIEPFFALCVLLYIACQHDKASKEDWFEQAVVRWCEKIFRPVNCNNSFVLEE